MPRRLVATAPHVVEVKEFDVPAVGPTQIRVKTETASGKHGTMKAIFDNVNFKGQSFDQRMRFFQPLPADAKPGSWSERALGTTAVGVVEEVGSEVTTHAVGDRVVGLMHVATDNVVEAHYAWPLGDADTFQVLGIEPGYVSFHSVRESNIRWGDTVAVFGLGAIGLIAVQMAYRAGASRVIAVDLLENRRAWALAHGADAALDPATDDVPLRVHELTDGLGADVTIEVSGSYAALESAIKSTRIRGTVAAAGFYQGEAKAVWFGREFHHNLLQMIVPHGCGWGHEPRDFPRWDELRAYATMVEMIGKGLLDLSGLIDPVVSIDEMPDVWRRIEHDPGTVIKYGVQF